MDYKVCFQKFKQITDNNNNNTFIENTQVLLQDIINRKNKLSYILYKEEYDDIYIACLCNDKFAVKRILLKIYYNNNSWLNIRTIRLDYLLFIALVMSYNEIIDELCNYIRYHHLLEIMYLIKYYDLKLFKNILTKSKINLNNFEYIGYTYKYQLVIIFDGMIPYNFGIPYHNSIYDDIELAIQHRCWGAVALFMCVIKDRDKNILSKYPNIIKVQISAKTIQRFWRRRKKRIIQEILIHKLNTDLSEYIMQKLY